MALTHLQDASDSKTSVLAFKAIKSVQVLPLGFCPDFGTCQVGGQ